MGNSSSPRNWSRISSFAATGWPSGSDQMARLIDDRWYLGGSGGCPCQALCSVRQHCPWYATEAGRRFPASMGLEPRDFAPARPTAARHSPAWREFGPRRLVALLRRQRLARLLPVGPERDDSP